jgi:hypothetical protein
MLEEVGNSPLMDTAIPRPGLFARAKWALIGGGVAILIAAALTYFRRGMAPSKRLAQP